MSRAGGGGVERGKKRRRRNDRKLIFFFSWKKMCFGRSLAVSGFEPKKSSKCLSRRRKERGGERQNFFTELERIKQEKNE